MTDPMLERIALPIDEGDYVTHVISSPLVCEPMPGDREGVQSPGYGLPFRARSGGCCDQWKSICGVV